MGTELDPSKVETGIDVVGDIAILRLPEIEEPLKRRLAEAMLAAIPSVKSVQEQEGGIEGEFRLRKLHHLAGENRTETVHRENGCAFRVDLGTCYYSPRLATERLRVADQVAEDERVLNMFAGVGPFSIPIARRRGASVLSCELNEKAFRFHLDNNKLNHVERLVKVVNEDAADLPSKLGEAKFDRILMPHPSRANEFLEDALALAAKGATIHYYRQVPGRDPAEANLSLESELEGLLPRPRSYVIRRIREVGPRWLELAADIRVVAG